MKIGASERIAQSNIAKFLAEFRASTNYQCGAGWINTVEIVLGINESGLYPENSVTIYCVIQHGARETGEASKALRWVCSLADKHDVTLSLYVEPIKKYQPGLSIVQLRKWYTRAGFVRYENHPYVMERKPRGS